MTERRLKALRRSPTGVLPTADPASDLWRATSSIDPVPYCVKLRLENTFLNEKQTRNFEYVELPMVVLDPSMLAAFGAMLTGLAALV
jgi:hypothetical protein